MQIFANLLAISLVGVGAVFLFGIMLGSVMLRTLERLGWLSRPAPKSDPVARTMGLLLGLVLMMLGLFLAVPQSRDLWQVVTLACVGVSLLLSLVVSLIEGMP